MKNIDNIIRENINAFVDGLVNESDEMIDGYEAANDPREKFIAVLEEKGLNINDDEGEVYFDDIDSTYDFCVMYRSRNNAYWSDEDETGYSTVQNMDSFEIDYAEVYAYDRENDEETEIEVDDELLDLLNKNANFDEYEVGQTESDYKHNYDAEHWDEYHDR